MGNGEKEKDRPDAGLRSLDHCERIYSIPRLPFHGVESSLTALPTDRTQLPLWRYWPRQKLLPLVRYETPYLAWFQEKIRSPSLDAYFAFAANLGTHTFFTVFLPVLFWCGHTRFGRGYVELAWATSKGEGPGKIQSNGVANLF